MRARGDVHTKIVQEEERLGGQKRLSASFPRRNRRLLSPSVFTFPSVCVRTTLEVSGTVFRKPWQALANAEGWVTGSRSPVII